MGISDRLRELIEFKGVTPYEVSARTGISEATLSRIINKMTVKPNQNNLDLLAKYFNVSKEWLRTGSGDMEREKEAVADNNNNSISIPTEVWDVIKDQAASLKSKDRQVDELIELLKKRQDVVEMYRAVNSVVEVEDE